MIKKQINDIKTAGLKPMLYDKTVSTVYLSLL